MQANHNLCSSYTTDVGKDKTGWNKYRRGPVKAASSDISVTIESLGHNGQGIGRHDGQVVFVPLTLPGERVLVKPVIRKKKFIRAELTRIQQPSPSRQTPPCEYFGHCGGCDWQHMPYKMQLEAKTDHLKDVLERIGKISNPDIKPIIESEQPFHYRNRIQGTVNDKQFHFRKRGTEELININACLIADDAINQYLQDGLSIDNVHGKVEISVHDQKVSVLRTNEKNSTDAGFRQVNNAVSRKLSELLTRIAEQHLDAQCIDLYCGRGQWSVAMAEKYPQGRFIGIDSSEQNIRIAKASAEKAQSGNIQFHHSRVETLLKKLPLDRSFCIVDPPRAGLSENVTSALNANQPEAIIYISCHPASLARDIALFTESRFKLESVFPFDMFPQTAHLETLCVLSRT